MECPIKLFLSTMLESDMGRCFYNYMTGRVDLGTKQAEIINQYGMLILLARFGF